MRRFSWRARSAELVSLPATRYPLPARMCAFPLFLATNGPRGAGSGARIHRVSMVFVLLFRRILGYIASRLVL